MISDEEIGMKSQKIEEKVSQNLFLSGSIYEDPVESRSVLKPVDMNEKPFTFINEFTAFELLPIVKIKFERRITRFYVQDYRGISIDELATDVTGLAEHLLATSPAAEATSAILAHVNGKLKAKKIDRVRIQFDGNSQGRLPAVKGLFDGGIKIICLCDITKTDNILRQRRPPRI